MARLQHMGKMASGLLLLFLSGSLVVEASPISHAEPLDAEPALYGRQAFDDPIGTPFMGFDGCSEEKSKAIRRAWWDVVELTRIPNGMNLGEKPGTLEGRIWGEDINTRDGAPGLIHTVYGNIFKMYTDKVVGKIRIGCKDIPQKNKPDSAQVKCSNIQTATQRIGGYAFNEGAEYEKSTIVLCPIFFAPGQAHLKEILDELRKPEHEAERKKGNGKAGKAHMLLHELTHLPVIEGQRDTSEVLVIDQYFEGGSVRAYGQALVEKFARGPHTRSLTHLNADHYAWYATLKYWEALFGTPDAYNVPRGGDDDEGEAPTKALTINLETNAFSKPFGNPLQLTQWVFYSVPYGTPTLCRTDPVADATGPRAPDFSKEFSPAGTFKVKTGDGDCEYKNNGEGNPGAVWCGDKGHGCRYHDDQKKGSEVEKKCDERAKTLKNALESKQRAMIVCEW